MTSLNVNCTSCVPASNITRSNVEVITRFEEYFAAVVTIIIILTALSGNSLVFCAFYRFRKLRSPTNYFIVNLAVMDFLVGLIPTVFWVAYLLFKWPPRGSDAVVYKIWEFFDVMCALGSILSLMFISVDRYICIKDALRYYSLVTAKRVLICIAFIWVYALSSGMLSILKNQIKGQGHWFRYYVFTAGFTIPLAIMIFCYANIFYETLRHSREMRAVQTLGVFVDESESKCDSDTKIYNSSLNEDDKQTSDSGLKNPAFQPRDEEINSVEEKKQNGHFPIEVNDRTPEQIWDIELEATGGGRKRFKSTKRFYPNGRDSGKRFDKPRDSIAIGWGESKTNSSALSKSPQSKPSKFPKNTEQTKRLQQKKADLKAARTLSFIMGVFLLTWTPFLMTLMIYAWKPSLIGVRWTYSVKCLHYSNSGFNPFLYTVLNRAFRRAFVALLCRKKY